ncbi:MAG: ArsR/SmtB family transcription factor [Candidatus Thorarchaeota archaeon]
MTITRLLWWLIAGTRGGINRARIIQSLHDWPQNAHQLAESLKLDYKTIKHHLDLLQEHNLISPEGDGYGVVYFLSSDMMSAYDEFENIWERASAHQKNKQNGESNHERT